MANFNKVILLGNLTRDIDVRYTPGGMAVADIGLAVNRTWFDKQSNQKKEETTFVDVTLWGRQAEVAGEYLAKGRSVLIEGRLQLETWDDKKTGEKRSKLKVVGESMSMIGGTKEGEPKAAAPARGAQDGAQGRQQGRPAGRPQQRHAAGSGRGRGPDPQDIPDDDVPF